MKPSDSFFAGFGEIRRKRMIERKKKWYEIGLMVFSSANFGMMDLVYNEVEDWLSHCQCVMHGFLVGTQMNHFFCLLNELEIGGIIGNPIIFVFLFPVNEKLKIFTRNL